MKKVFFAFAFAFLHFIAIAKTNVILLIGDGLSPAQIALADEYARAMNAPPLAMNSFEVHSLTRTASASSLVTDSAAAGTAIATGFKTKNGFLGLDSNEEKLTSVAIAAKRAGKKVALISSVPITHATPSAFYANVASRTSSTEIEEALKAANFDFTFGITERKFIIDSKDTPQTLAALTREALTKLEDNFFMMIEGGAIDWACHANDTATMIQEILEFDDAVRVALDFQKKNTNTLVVVTGDHETGGLSLGISEHGYALYPKVLSSQTMSGEMFARKYLQLLKEGKNSFSDDILPLVKTAFGSDFGNEEKLLAAFESDCALFAQDIQEDFTYDKVRKYNLSRLCLRLMSKKAAVGWSSNYHTALPVITMAQGENANLFMRARDNTDIAKIIFSLL